MAYLGGMSITSIRWLAFGQSILVAFSSTYTDRSYQLFAGRTLIGIAPPGATKIIGQLSPSHYPQVIQLLAISASEALTDFGPTLPPRPYNKASFSIDTSGLEADAATIEITAGTEPEGAVSATNVLATLPHEGQDAHEFVSEPLGPSGEWNFEAIPYDSRPTGGNEGDALEIAVEILSHPPDVVIDSNGDRFTVALSSGSLTVTATLPTDQSA